jgi:hypothetical protein
MLPDNRAELQTTLKKAQPNAASGLKSKPADQVPLGSSTASTLTLQTA